MSSTTVGLENGEAVRGRPSGPWLQLWRRLSRKRIAMFGLAVVLAIYLMGITASRI